MNDDQTMCADWSYDGDQWNHCDRPAWSDDEGVTCSKCQASFAWDDDECA